MKIHSLSPKHGGWYGDCHEPKPNVESIVLDPGRTLRLLTSGSDVAFKSCVLFLDLSPPFYLVEALFLISLLDLIQFLLPKCILLDLILFYCSQSSSCTVPSQRAEMCLLSNVADEYEYPKPLSRANREKRSFSHYILESFVHSRSALPLCPRRLFFFLNNI
jgi:hypothetical protein